MIFPGWYITENSFPIVKPKLFNLEFLILICGTFLKSRFVELLLSYTFILYRPGLILQTSYRKFHIVLFER